MPSTPLYFTLVTLIVVLNVAGQTLFKIGSGSGYFNGFILAALSAYAVSAAFYIKLLSFSNLSTTFPLVIGLTILITFFGGVYYLNEQASWIHWIGVFLIFTGITLFVLGGN